MTLEQTHELIVMHDHGQHAVDALIREYDLEKQWEIQSGTRIATAFKS